MGSIAEKKTKKRAKKAKKTVKRPKKAIKEPEFLSKLKEKRWDKKLEPAIFAEWQKQRLFAFDKKSRKPLYSIDTPPPYVNTPIHIGHAYTYVIMDMIARFKRMAGFNVIFPMGLDKNGLPIEIQAEKTFGISLHETPRDEFITKCKQLIEEAGDASLDSFKRLGLSCNSWKTTYEVGGKYDTDDPEYRKLTQETFIEFWKRGLVYEDLKPTNYCPICRTTISDAEVEYKEEKTKLVYIKFEVKETAHAPAEIIRIATTRPELLCTCKLIIFNPEDPRYTHLNGRRAFIPIFGQEVPIMAHPYAKPDFGSGIMMVCSFGDYGDVRLLRGLDITPTYAINEFGRMNKNAGKYKGLTVAEARAAIIDDLRAADLIEEEETIDQRQPMCWRSKNPVEFVPMKEFYLKQVEFKDDILAVADKMKFFAPESKQILLDWVKSINIDWVLSRRRYYGTEIPLWYCKKCGAAVTPNPGKYYRPWKEGCPVKACSKCGESGFEGETRVFDTWFDSSSSNMYVMGYLWDKNFFRKHFPATLRPQGKEIVRTWLYFTILKSLLLLKKPAFQDVWLHYHVVDDKGNKMSKSLGNIINPQDVLNKYGAEAFRIWTCLENDIARGDTRCSFERIEGTSKFLTKLWNIARFISTFPVPDVLTKQAKRKPKATRPKIKLEKSDEWIVAELAKLVKFVRNNYENYGFFDAVTETRNFAWNIFAAHYIEMVKARAYDSEHPEAAQAAWYTLHECLRTLLLLLAPIIPFVTEKTWKELYAVKNESIHSHSFPEPPWTETAAKYTQALTEFNSKVWNTKKEKGMSLKDPIEIEIPKNLKLFKKDLIRMHNIK